MSHAWRWYLLGKKEWALRTTAQHNFRGWYGKTLCSFRQAIPPPFCLWCPVVVGNESYVFTVEKLVDKITSASWCLQYTLWQMFWLSKEWFPTYVLWQVQIKTRVGICCLTSVFYSFSFGGDTKLQMYPTSFPLAFNRRKEIWAHYLIKSKWIQKTRHGGQWMSPLPILKFAKYT